VIGISFAFLPVVDSDSGALGFVLRNLLVLLSHDLASLSPQRNTVFTQPNDLAVNFPSGPRSTPMLARRLRFALPGRRGGGGGAS
jgi:hypothetical protein